MRIVAAITAGKQTVSVCLRSVEQQCFDSEIVKYSGSTA